MSQSGLVHVYTGNGKGKTTAAFGLALRTWGHGGQACLVQFMKCGEEYGEVKAVKRLPGIVLRQFGRPGFVIKGKHSQEDVELARQALAFSAEALTSGKYDLVVMDEVCVALDFGLLEVSEVIKAVDSRSEKTEVVLTGINAPKELIEKADLVTEMRMIKHPYESGIIAREMIEY
ncbi:MAG: cob(I)yrinic acid a,c-diamide adenosyltransferase [Methanomassiliicoccales archaeon]|nr:cob(I)yrinic acid a,c-diamide adenosyltransferase [Methanomassiliicoccales archaeon]